VTTLAEAEALLIQARADLAKQMIKKEWATILVEVLAAQESMGAPAPDFTGHWFDHGQLIGLAEAYYGNRLNEIESIDNVMAFLGMVTEAIGEQLAEFNLKPELYRSLQSGSVRLFFVDPRQATNT
jgi:hypothetical protein